MGLSFPPGSKSELVTILVITTGSAFDKNVKTMQSKGILVFCIPLTQAPQSIAPH